MPAVLNTNAASLYASKNLQSAQSRMAQSVERLSSGLRINRAMDDAAGLGISNSLTSQINGANQGIRNLNDGISMVQTAEGAIAAAQEMGQRILTLATQGANGTLGVNERTAIQNEMKQLLTAIDGIGSRTKLSGTSLLNNDARTSTTTAAAPTATKFSLQASNQTTDVLALSSAGFLNIGGAYGTVSANVNANTTATNAVAFVTTETLSQSLVGTSVYRVTRANGGADANVYIGTKTSTTTSTVASIVNNANGTTTVNLTAGVTEALTANDVLLFSGQLTQVHSGTATDMSLAQAVGSSSLINALPATALAGFQMVQRAADGYLAALTTQRSLLGAYQNQIEYTVSNITELSANLNAARSNVQDTDYATETATLTKGQILQQAATAMLAQANQMPNVILSLLK
jgi:flagellin